MNRWVTVGFILALIMLPTVALSVKNYLMSNVEGKADTVKLIDSSQNTGVSSNTVLQTISPTFLPSNSSTPTATQTQTKTIPTVEIIALSTSIMVALVCLWLCFRKPNPEKTVTIQSRIARMTENQPRQPKIKSQYSPQALETRICHSSHQPLKPLVIEQL